MNFTVSPWTTRGDGSPSSPFSPPPAGTRPSGKTTTSQQEFPDSRMPSFFICYKEGGKQSPCSLQETTAPHPPTRPLRRPRRLRPTCIHTSLRPLKLSQTTTKKNVEQPAAFGLYIIAGGEGSREELVLVAEARQHDLARPQGL